MVPLQSPSIRGMRSYVITNIVCDPRICAWPERVSGPFSTTLPSRKAPESPPAALNLIQGRQLAAPIWGLNDSENFGPLQHRIKRDDDTPSIDDNRHNAASMSMFRAKKLDLGCNIINTRIVRDHTKRKTFAAFEPERQALRYIIRNTTLPARTRAEAQLQLTQMHCYTRPTQIRGRCILGGKTRGILRDFKLSRYNFRMQALSGNIPGVRKASW
ncbi:hypothetical protein F5Y18DRAFT_428678 [Xylariaceae sp. FL1019]|nr:hypothetical protein F5Y18DRAFT_428678 [Xylariaceae sp. FL1019]